MIDADGIKRKYLTAFPKMTDWRYNHLSRKDRAYWLDQELRVALKLMHRAADTAYRRQIDPAFRP